MPRPCPLCQTETPEGRACPQCRTLTVGIAIQAEGLVGDATEDRGPWLLAWVQRYLARRGPPKRTP